ncbi:MAG: HAMP domain-containing histidine kinase [Oscillospiraceae bacterium]|nr:HAMP domain-containing histidine kinase [Oscillospiraceae bacterium]
MRLRTFLSTYILFLAILFISVGTVSAYMTNNQAQMLQEKSTREYQTIATSIVRDMVLIENRNLDFQNFSAALNELMNNYTINYRRYNIELALINTLLMDELPAEESENPTLSFQSEDGTHLILISGSLPEPFQDYRLYYQLDITEEIANTEQVRRIILVTSIGFSVFAAIALYLILRNIFKPLTIIARASKNIADGQYQKRIYVKGKHELAKVASAFNQMADQVEGHIKLLEEESERKQQFVDNFAHEIRTPLTSIFGYAEYLQKTSIREDELIESTGHIMNESTHIGMIANSLLELAVLRDYVPKVENISITELFKEIRQTLSSALREKGIHFYCECKVDYLEGQADLIKMLLLNLCRNALAACTPNKGAILLEAYQDSRYIILSVTDKGCGIPGESLQRLTEPFYRVDKVRSRAEGGAGLGLTLCNQIADVHNAKLRIESKVGIGTRVSVVFTNS